MDSAHRRLLFQCGGITNSTGLSAAQRACTVADRDQEQLGIISSERLLLLGLIAAALAVFDRAFEITNTFAQAFAKIRELARSEDEKGNDQKNQKLRHSKFTEHKTSKRFRTLMIGHSEAGVKQLSVVCYLGA